MVGSSADTINSDFGILVEHISGPGSCNLDDCFTSTGCSFIAELSDCRSFTAAVPSNCVDCDPDSGC